MDSNTYGVGDFNIHQNYSMTDKMDKIRKIWKNEYWSKKKIINSQYQKSQRPYFTIYKNESKKIF